MKPTIVRKIARPDPGAVRTLQHNEQWLRKFAAAVQAIPEIVEAYRMSGDIDYMLRIVVPDIAGYDAVYRKLIRSVELSDVSSSFAMYSAIVLSMRASRETRTPWPSGKTAA